MADATYRNIQPASQRRLSDAVSPTLTEPPGRKKASLACLACRRRRSKCDAGNPCVSCIQRNTDCVKDEFDDGRRKLALRRKIDILEKNCNLLDELLLALRTFSAQDLDALLTVVRNNATREEIFRHLSNTQRSSSESMQLDSPKHESSRNRRRMLGRIEDMVNPPISVPAKPWTTVTSDDDFVSHLVSLWFTWAHQWWHWVDGDIFLEEMRRGNTNSKICTPYLVNIILADACLLDTLQDGETEPNQHIRGLFYEEAKQGIEKEAGKVSLALVSALGIQWTYLNMNGQDGLGNAVLYQQLYHSKDLDKWRQKLGRDPQITQQELDKIDISLSRLQWTLFALNAYTSLNFEKTQSVDPPTIPKISPDSHSNGQVLNWTPYPQPHGAYSFHENCLYLTFLSLAEVANREEDFFRHPASQGQNMAEVMRRFDKLYQELKDWPSTIPDCLTLHEDSTPHVIALHSLYGWVVVRLAKQAAALESGNSRDVSLIQTPESADQVRLRDVCIAMSIRVSKLLEQIRTAWNADHFPVIIMQPLAIAVFPLLEGLHERPDSQDALYNLLVVARAAGRRFRVGQGILNLLRQTTTQNDIKLPDQCQQLLSDNYDSESPGHGLAYLLEKWQDLDLSDT